MLYLSGSAWLHPFKSLFVNASGSSAERVVILYSSPSAAAQMTVISPNSARSAGRCRRGHRLFACGYRDCGKTPFPADTAAVSAARSAQTVAPYVALSQFVPV